ncbi:MAG: CotH kinase family protein, partial [Bacteroidales bacterium]|nr:CotH kinase family protein [Bacteroidales bacterium]
AATMKILYVDDTPINNIVNQNDPYYLNYNGRIAIETRGSTSQEHNKKPYGFETRLDDDSTNNNVSLMGLPPENDWVLNAINDDNSYLRDCLSYTIGARLGHYTPRVRYCEVVVNGDYRGIYFLTEKIKIDNYRLDLSEMDSSDTSGAAVTGGYIVKADKTTGGDPIAWTTTAHDYWEDVNYIYHAPKPDAINAAQGQYIRSVFDSLQSVATNSSVTDGYPSIIDVPSFVDYMIMGELSSNVDIYQKSTFFHKDQLGKLRAGPLWDFNLAYGNDLGSSPGRSQYNVWQFDNGDNTGSEFWYRMFNEPQFQCLFARRWHRMTDTGRPLCYDSVCAVIDSLYDVASAAITRDRQRWFKWNNPTQNIAQMKQWLLNRYNWINSHLGDTTACSSPIVMQLVITSINYHPLECCGFTDKELEFVGITNIDSVAVDVTGVYFPLLGFAYQFPAGSILAPGEEVYIVADTTAFTTVYRERAFGQFGRHLANSSQRLLITDAWGNTIDDVAYRDHVPWPEQADGGGAFLKLVDLTADNSQPENWTIAYVLHYDTIHHRDTLYSTTLHHSRDTLAQGDTLVVIDTLFIIDSTIYIDTIEVGPDTSIWFDTLVHIDTIKRTDTIFNTPVAIADANELHIEVYPNPTGGRLTVHSSGAAINRLTLYSIDGRRLRRWHPYSHSATIDLTRLPDGIYMLSLQTNDGIATHRISKSSASIR